MRTFVIGDIHGAYRALVQCLERCQFDKEKDLLITLGDICDGWTEVYECVEELLTIKNRIDIIGNHDRFFIDWLNTAVQSDRWRQGGLGTLESYTRALGVGVIDVIAGGYMTSLLREDIPASHWKFFKHQRLYYKDDLRNMFFVHGGFDRFKSITDNRHDHPSEFYWNRDLWEKAMSCKGDQKLQTIDNFGEIFIGHTATTNWTIKEEHTATGIVIPKGAMITVPMFSGGVWNMDTGAGWHGKLTIMNISTKEFWQSDLVTDLYPEEAFRKGIIKWHV